MGGIGGHHVHLWSSAASSFVVACMFPLGALALSAGAWWERHRRTRRPAERAVPRTVVAARFAAQPD